jgi:hypothetical protein
MGVLSSADKTLINVFRLGVRRPAWTTQTKHDRQSLRATMQPGRSSDAESAFPRLHRRPRRGEVGEQLPSPGRRKAAVGVHQHGHREQLGVLEQSGFSFFQSVIVLQNLARQTLAHQLLAGSGGVLLALSDLPVVRHALAAVADLLKAE